MKPDDPEHREPLDAALRRAHPAVVAYPPEALPPADLEALRHRRSGVRLVRTVTVPPREAVCVEVPAGSFFRIVSTEGPQVGDLNLWAKEDISERFFSGKTRALHGTHLSTGDRLWSTLPHLRAMATITDDTLDWYGWDADGASVHDVIGTRCDPYTHHLLTGEHYHHCCHSNLTRALAAYMNLPTGAVELEVHDVLNVFMCTGFTHDTHQYFMKASPVRPGDHLEFHAEMDLLVGLSACPGGDCSATHSSDEAACFPLLIEIYASDEPARATIGSGYDGTHGLG